MREVSVSRITDAVARMCISANISLPRDMREGIRACRACEDGAIARTVLDQITENYEIAEREQVPICQDTGMACVFLELGQDVHIDGDLDAAVQDGVRDGYARGYLRCSVVADPLRRTNTGDNTPGMLTVRIVPGDKQGDRKSTRLNSSHSGESRMPSSA